MIKRLLSVFPILLLSVAAFGQIGTPSNEQMLQDKRPQSKIDEIDPPLHAKGSPVSRRLSKLCLQPFCDRAVRSGMGGQIAGEYRLDSLMMIIEDGSRFERSRSSRADDDRLTVTPEDLEDLGGVNPFAIDPQNVDKYNFNYLGMEKIDELETFVFDVTPKVIPDPKKSKLRLFTGRVWVEAEDEMIVKTRGKAVPETKENKFPIVET